MGATSRSSAAVVTALLVAAIASSATTATTTAGTTTLVAPPTAEPLTGVWDAYPATIISVCPHIPRRSIDFNQLNGRWFVMEKGGFWRPENLCEMDFLVEEGQNLTLHISLRAFSDGNLVNHFNSTWIMSEDNVWRDYEESQMFMFLGYSTGRSLLLVCAVDGVGNTNDGYSLALAKDLAFVRTSVLAAARLPGNVEATDRLQCPDT